MEALAKHAANPPPAGPLPKWMSEASRYSSDPVAAARSLRGLIEEQAAQGERMGCIAEPVARALAASGLFGLLVPREFGGIEADPATYIATIEELSYADASVGWVMMATTFGTGGIATQLGDGAVREIFEGSQGFVAAGQIAALGVAERRDGGYAVSGQFQFGSGAQLASWMFGAFVLQEDGRTVLEVDGTPKMVWCVAPRTRIRIDEASWDVVGLAGTGSYDYAFEEQFIPDEFVMQPFNRPRGGPIYEVGVSLGHVSWALGAGMRALDEIAALARRKQRPGRQTLIEQPTFQRDFALATAEMEAARAYVRGAFSNWFEEANVGKPSLHVRMQGRLASCWATRIAARVGNFAYLAGGSDGARNDDGNRLQRFFRDLHVGATHKHVDDNVLIECGSVLLGVNDPDVVL